MRIGPMEIVVLLLLAGFLLFVVVSQRHTRPASEVLEAIFDEPATRCTRRASTPTPTPSTP